MVESPDRESADGAGFNISCVLTALNEETEIDYAFQVHKEGMRLSGKVAESEFFLIDDGSMDSTLEKMNAIAASETNVTVIANGTNKGIGSSFNTAVPLCKYDNVIFGFGYVPHEKSEIAKIYALLGTTDLVTTYAIAQARPATRLFLSRMYVGFLNILFGNKMIYYNGSTIYPLAHLRTIEIYSENIGVFSEVLIKLLNKGLSCEEVGLRHMNMPRSAASNGRKLKTIVNVLKTLAHLILAIHLRGGTRS